MNNFKRVLGVRRQVDISDLPSGVNLSFSVLVERNQD